MYSKTKKTQKTRKIKSPKGLKKAEAPAEVDKTLVLQKRNVDELSKAIPSLSHRLNYLSLRKNYCENYKSNSKNGYKSCDCVNIETNQLMCELFPSTIYLMKQSSRQNGSAGLNGKSLKRVDFTSSMGLGNGGGDTCEKRSEKILRFLTMKIEKLRVEIRFYEDKIRAIICQFEK